MPAGRNYSTRCKCTVLKYLGSSFARFTFSDTKVRKESNSLNYIRRGTDSCPKIQSCRPTTRIVFPWNLANFTCCCWVNTLESSYIPGPYASALFFFFFFVATGQEHRCLRAGRWWRCREQTDNRPRERLKKYEHRRRPETHRICHSRQ